jgi:hypothetical protein
MIGGGASPPKASAPGRAGPAPSAVAARSAKKPAYTAPSTVVNCGAIQMVRLPATPTLPGERGGGTSAMRGAPASSVTRWQLTRCPAEVAPRSYGASTRQRSMASGQR